MESRLSFKMTESKPIESDEKAKIFADKLFPCEPPCDSYGVCSNCCERMTFEAGYEFGFKAEREKVRELVDAVKPILERFIRGTTIETKDNINQLNKAFIKAKE